MSRMILEAGIAVQPHLAWAARPAAEMSPAGSAFGVPLAHSAKWTQAPETLFAGLDFHPGIGGEVDRVAEAIRAGGFPEARGIPSSTWHSRARV